MKNMNTRAYAQLTTAKNIKNEDVNKLIIKYRKEKNETKQAEIAEILVQQYIKLIFKISHPFANAYGDINDAIQNGVLGLYDAIEKYDTNRNANFGTFAFMCIYNSIYSGYGYSFFNVPRHVKHAIAQMNRQDDEKENPKSKLSTKSAAVSGKRKVFIKKFAKDRDRITNVASLSTPIYSDSKASTIEDIVSDKSPGPEEIVLKDNLINKINDIIDHGLSEREKIVIRKRYFHTDGVIKTLHEIGKDLNISFEAVRLIEKAAAKKIKNKLRIYQ